MKYWAGLGLRGKKRGIGLRCAINGIIAAYKRERNFRIHTVAAVMAISMGFLLRLGRVEWLVLVIAIGLVLQAELFNTAVEKMIDYIKPEIHPVAGLIKDLAAGAVLVTAFTAFATGLLLFIPKLYKIFF